MKNRFAESDVKCPTPTPTFPNFRLRHLYITWVKFGCQQFLANSNQWKLWYSAKIFCFNKGFKRNCTISRGIPKFGVWYKKWFNSISGVGVGQKNPTPIHGVVIVLRFHPKTSDSLRLRHRLCNPGEKVEFSGYSWNFIFIQFGNWVLYFIAKH